MYEKQSIVLEKSIENQNNFLSKEIDMDTLKKSIVTKLNEK
jgi:hypothetical protein